MRISRQWLGTEVFTGILVVLIALAVTDASFVFVAVQLALILDTVGIVHLLFPGSRFFAISLANFIAIYSCLFVFLLEANFLGVDRWAAFPGFALPVLAFLAGVWGRRGRIRRVIEVPALREERHFGRILLWLVPMLLIAAGTFFIPKEGLSARTTSAAAT